MTAVGFRHLLRGIESSALRLSKALALAGLVVLLMFAVATLFDGLLRHLINRPIDFVRDAGGLVVAVTVVACFPLAMLSQSNISIRLIDLALPGAISRLLAAVASVAVWVTFFLVAIEFFWLARDFARSNDTTVMLGIPKAPFWYAADAMFWVAVATQSLVVAADILRCFADDSLEPHGEPIADEPV